MGAPSGYGTLGSGIGSIYRAPRAMGGGSGYTLPRIAPPTGLQGYSLPSLRAPIRSMGPSLPRSAPTARAYGTGQSSFSLPGALETALPASSEAATATGEGSASAQPSWQPGGQASLSASAMLEARLAQQRKEYLGRAVSRFREGDYESARSMFKIVATMEKQPGTGQLGIVHASLAGRKYASAAAAMGPLLRVGANIFQAGFLGMLYERPEAFAEDVTAFRKMMARGPTDASVWALASYVYGVMGQRQQAEEAARKAVELAPEEAGYRALLEIVSGQPPTADSAS